MLADGDMIGDHTWTHPDMTKLSAGEQTSQLQLTADAIRRATGFSTVPLAAALRRHQRPARLAGALARPDHDQVGRRHRATGRCPEPPTIYQRAVNGAHNGAIILQHFGGGPRYETLDALPAEINTLRAAGYKFVTIPQLLGLKLIYRKRSALESTP